MSCRKLQCTGASRRVKAPRHVIPDQAATTRTSTRQGSTRSAARDRPLSARPAPPRGLAAPDHAGDRGRKHHPWVLSREWTPPKNRTAARRRLRSNHSAPAKRRPKEVPLHDELRMYSTANQIRDKYLEYSITAANSRDCSMVDQTDIGRTDPAVRRREATPPSSYAEEQRDAVAVPEGETLHDQPDTQAAHSAEDPATAVNTPRDETPSAVQS